MIKINYENIEKLKNRILAEPNTFAMQNIFFRTDVGVKTDNYCGTVACICGHITLLDLGKNIEEVKYLPHESSYNYISLDDDEYCYYRAAEFMGISSSLATDLFEFDWPEYMLEEMDHVTMDEFDFKFSPTERANWAIKAIDWCVAYQEASNKGIPISRLTDLTTKEIKKLIEEKQNES